MPCRGPTAILAAGVLAVALPAGAEPTHLMIRALSEDAKFIGDHTGGVEVTVRDAATRQVLSHGVIHGGTGDTTRIMTAPRGRGAILSDADTAGFDAVIDIARPTRVEVEAHGPLGLPASAITVRSEAWVAPGQAVAGDGWILHFPGLLITPAITRSADGGLRLDARVTVMCGCPISPGGLWDEANYRIEADVLDGGVVVTHARLAYTGQPSQFTARLPRLDGRPLTVRVVAAQTNSPNTGVVELAVP